MNTFFLNIWAFLKRVGHFIKNMGKLVKIAFSNKFKYALVDEALNGYSFDFGFLYNIEYKKLAEMKNYFEKYGLAEDNDKFIKQIDLAMRLLYIINNDNELYDYVEDKTSSAKTWIERVRYKSNVNVNLKNAKRFAKSKYEVEFYNKCPHELYLLKAKHLYHKVRDCYEQTWWD